MQSLKGCTISNKNNKIKNNMACLIANGYPLGCRDNTGGVQRVLIKSFVPSIVYTYDVNGQITASSVTGEQFYELFQTQEAGDFKQDGQHAVDKGTNFYNQTVSVILFKYQASLRDLIYTLAQSEVVILVQDQNSNWFIVGEQNGANLTASTASVGKAYGDMNGSTLTFLGKEPSPARECVPAYIAQLVIS